MCKFTALTFILSYFIILITRRIAFMPIENQKVSNNTPSIAHPKGTTTNTPNHVPNSKSEVMEGQIIRGEIIDLRKEEVTIEFSNGLKITGQTNDSSNLYIGQTTSFRVTSLTPKTILLECLAKTFSNQELVTIRKALEEADLPKTERNTEIVKELLANRMPINKQMLQTMIQQMANTQANSARTVITMNRYDIPISTHNVAQFESYQEGTHSILPNIEEMSAELPELMQTLSEQAPAKLVATFGRELMGIVTDHINSIPHRSYNIPNAEPTIDIDKPNLVDATIEAPLTIEEDILYTPKEAKQYINYLNNAVSQYMTEEQCIEFKEQLSALKLPSPVLEGIQKGTIPTIDVFSSIYNAASNENSTQLASLFQSELFATVFKHTLKQLWSVQPKNLLQNEKHQTYYDNLTNDMNKIMNLIKSNLGGEASEVISNQTTLIKDNIDFMGHLNQLFTYIQLPIKLQDQTEHKSEKHTSKLH